MTALLKSALAIMIFAAFLIFTKGGRILKIRLKGSTSELIRKDASTPDGARAYYAVAIDRKAEDLSRAEEIESAIIGKVKGCEDQIRALNAESDRIDHDAAELIKKGEENRARILVEKQVETESRVKILEEALKKLHESEKVQSESVAELSRQLSSLKAERDDAVLALEMAELTDTVGRSRKDESMMLDAVREGVKKRQERSEGIRIRKDRSLEGAQKEMERILAKEKIEQKMEQLKNARP